ncbi:hypothetical protein PF010_g32514 [Phytophthora fragariae]|nr:hypothetical protein PF010_g32514 [Phytophthora fragariae]KAE9157289.1 hypothetical protein PF004_g32282 [Phytophthora fragariae]
MEEGEEEQDSSSGDASSPRGRLGRFELKALAQRQR